VGYLGFRVTERNAKCNCCGKDVDRNTDKLVFFMNKCNNYATLKLCEDCVERMSVLFSKSEV